MGGTVYVDYMEHIHRLQYACRDNSTADILTLIYVYSHKAGQWQVGILQCTYVRWYMEGAWLVPMWMVLRVTAQMNDIDLTYWTTFVIAYIECNDKMEQCSLSTWTDLTTLIP